MLGFLLQWPTLLTLLMFPILVAMYVRLARREEREAIAEFGDEYVRYMAVTPAFIPRWRRPLPRPVSAESRARREVGRKVRIIAVRLLGAIVLVSCLWPSRSELCGCWRSGLAAVDQVCGPGLLGAVALGACAYGGLRA